MRPKLRPATAEDAEAVAALRNAVSDHLTFQHGKGPWTAHSTTAGALLDLRTDLLLVALHRDEVIATLKLSAKRPDAIDPSHFSQARRPVYLTSLAVAPDRQGHGIGGSCLEQAIGFARRQKADAIFLAAWDHPSAGTGPFWTGCGWREAGRTRYRETPFIHYERMLSAFDGLTL